MFALKACPRCQRGDVYLDRTGELVCFQCGYELPPAARMRFPAELASAEQQREPVVRAA